MRKILLWGASLVAVAMLGGCYYYPYPPPAYYYGYPGYAYPPANYPPPAGDAGAGTVTPTAPSSGTITPTPPKKN